MFRGEYALNWLRRVTVEGILKVGRRLANYGNTIVAPFWFTLPSYPVFGHPVPYATLYTIGLLLLNALVNWLTYRRTILGIGSPGTSIRPIAEIWSFCEYGYWLLKVLARVYFLGVNCWICMAQGVFHVILVRMPRTCGPRVSRRPIVCT